MLFSVLIARYFTPMRTIVIIGAGFSGTMVAVHLLRRRLRVPTALMLVERRGRFTAGIAYGTDLVCHVLNVPAGRMSAFSEDPDHFLRWLKKRDPAIAGGSFVSRYFYGAYLEDTLREAALAAPANVSFACIGAEARALHATGPVLEVSLSAGGSLRADAVVLAVGNSLPANPPIADNSFYLSERYARDPWKDDALSVGRDEPLLILGTGLTMMDVALALRDRGHRGQVTAISRRGLVPQSHRDSASPPPHLKPPADVSDWPPTARGQLHSLRCHIDNAKKQGIDWREVVTSLREETPALWQALDSRERARFLRHLRPYWETHRHRAATQTAAGVQNLISAGRLEIIAGSVISLRDDHTGVHAEIRRRGTNEMISLRVARVINCTGPATDLERVDDPFLRSLHRCGLISRDEHGLGVQTAPDAAAIDARGYASDKLFIAGPLRKATLFEHTAVAELRVAAHLLADRLEQIPPRGG